jgi:hypothetical protein
MKTEDGFDYVTHHECGCSQATKVAAEEGKLLPGKYSDRWWKRVLIVLTVPVWVPLLIVVVVSVCLAFLLWAGFIGQPIAYIVTGRTFTPDLCTPKGWWPEKTP